jgi:hypothetical protein
MNSCSRDWSGLIVSIIADSYLVEELDPPVSRYIRRVGGGVLLPGGRVLCPSELVLIPPLLLADFNRYPLVDPTIQPPTGSAPNYPVVASRIIVNVRVNGSMHAYLMSVTHLRGDGNLAILQVNDTHPFNTDAPDIPDIGFNISNGIENGEKIQVIGYTNSNNNSYGGMEAISINPGSVSLDYYMDPSGWIHSQLSLLSVSGVYNNQIGAAVVNSYGCLLGLVVAAPTGTWTSNSDNNYSNSGFIQAGLPHLSTSGDGRVACIHHREIQLFLRAINTRYSVEVIDDVVNGMWERILTGYIGLSYRQFRSNDYVDNIDFDGSITGTPGYEYPIDIDVSSGRPNKTVNGILITSIAGDISSLPSHMTPGSPQQGTDKFPLIIPDSALISTIPPTVPGDRLISISYNNGVDNIRIAVGGQLKEYSPSLVLSSLGPGDTVILETSSSLTNPKFDDIVETTLMLDTMPAFLDFPYYAWNRYSSVQPLPTGFEPPI